jgi:hypothetical protein
MKTLRISFLVVAPLLLASEPHIARAAGCLSISGSTSPVPLGTTLSFAAQCCSGVPALGNHWWILAGLLLVAGVLSLGRASRLATGLLLAGIVTVFARPASGQACGAPFQWQAKSATETFTGTGATFSFTPTAPGTFMITLSDPSETAPTVSVQVTPVSGDSVLMHHKNPSRDGLYVQPLLTKTAAMGLHRDATFTSASVTGAIYAQPLFVDGGATGTDLVIVATEANNVYALNGKTGAVVWLRNLGAPLPVAHRPCGNIDPYGVTSTPVIDWTSRTLFVGATTTPDGGTTTKHLVFALSVDDGSVKAGWPVDVGATAVSGSTTFSDPAQGDRGALTLLNGTLYAVYGGLFGDCGTYHGWVVGISITTPSQVQAWATAARGGGIWAPGGASSDGTNLFVSTGNTFGVTVWGGGEAVLRFTPGSSFATPTFWAPTNWQALDNGDVDLGGTTPIPFSLAGATPSKLALALGKDGNAYLVDPANLPGVGAPLVKELVASNSIISAAAVYTTATATYAAFKAAGTLCTSGGGGDLTTIKIVPGSPPTIAGSWCATQGGTGSPIVTTTDGTSNAIVWSVGAENSEQLHGFDGDTGATIYTSGAIPGVHRYNSPIAAKGRLFVAGDGGVVAFTP